MFDIEEFRDLEIAVKDHSPCDLSTIWSLQPVAVFLPPVIWVCLHLCLHRELRQKPCSVISWCVTVIEIGTSRKSTWHFLLVFLCNCLLSFSGYDDLLVENRPTFFRHLYPPDSRWNYRLECFPGSWNLGYETGVSGLSLPDRKPHDTTMDTRTGMGQRALAHPWKT